MKQIATMLISLLSSLPTALARWSKLDSQAHLRRMTGDPKVRGPDQLDVSRPTVILAGEWMNPP